MATISDSAAPNTSNIPTSGDEPCSQSNVPATGDKPQNSILASLGRARSKSSSPVPKNGLLRNRRNSWIIPPGRASTNTTRRTGARMTLDPHSDNEGPSSSGSEASSGEARTYGARQRREAKASHPPPQPSQQPQPAGTPRQIPHRPSRGTMPLPPTSFAEFTASTAPRATPDQVRTQAHSLSTRTEQTSEEHAANVPLLNSSDNSGPQREQRPERHVRFDLSQPQTPQQASRACALLAPFQFVLRKIGILSASGTDTNGTNNGSGNGHGNNASAMTTPPPPHANANPSGQATIVPIQTDDNANPFYVPPDMPGQNPGLRDGWRNGIRCPRIPLIHVLSLGSVLFTIGVFLALGLWVRLTPPIDTATWTFDWGATEDPDAGPTPWA